VNHLVSHLSLKAIHYAVEHVPEKIVEDALKESKNKPDDKRKRRSDEIIDCLRPHFREISMPIGQGGVPNSFYK
jgi:hypothetical protein